MDFGDILERWEREKDAERSKEDRREGGREARPRPDGGREDNRDGQGSGASRQKAATRGGPSAAHRSLDLWLQRHGVDDKDLRAAEDDRLAASAKAAEAARRAELKPQDRIDLHGMRAEEAARELDDFLLRSARAGLEKVLVVHGKGNHSAGEPVLGKVARRVIEASPAAGRFGEADKGNGGKGALWVLLKKEG
jgi:DNA-nicking Smr family endonuclease